MVVVVLVVEEENVVHYYHLDHLHSDSKLDVLLQKRLVIVLVIVLVPV